MEIIAVPDQTTTTCANVMLNEVIARFGCPLSLHSDQGRTMKAKSLMSYASWWRFLRPGPHLEILDAMVMQNVSTEPY